MIVLYLDVVFSNDLVGSQFLASTFINFNDPRLLHLPIAVIVCVHLQIVNPDPTLLHVILGGLPWCDHIIVLLSHTLNH